MQPARRTPLCVAVLMAGALGATACRRAPANEPPKSGTFDLECRYDLSSCRSQAEEQCGSGGYHFVSQRKTVSFADIAYWYVKAVCGREGAPDDSVWGSQTSPPGTGKKAPGSTE
jgi:hypothetical protein